MPVPKLALPKLILPKIAQMRQGPAAGLAEIRKSLNDTAAQVEGSLPKGGGQSIKRFTPKLPRTMTNFIKDVEEKLPWKPNGLIPLSGGSPERGSLEETPPPPSVDIPTRGSL
ncbi:MAG: hypothetical protein WC551_08100 [Patescibacteria group bacterium]